MKETYVKEFKKATQQMNQMGGSADVVIFESGDNWLIAVSESHAYFALVRNALKMYELLLDAQLRVSRLRDEDRLDVLVRAEHISGLEDWLSQVEHTTADIGRSVERDIGWAIQDGISA